MTKPKRKRHEGGAHADLAPIFPSAGLRSRGPTSRPFVLINMAMTADGKIATSKRALSSFGSPRDQEHLYELRATVDAVMCGARTVELSDTMLGPGGSRYRRLRIRHGLAEYNLRVIASGSGSINPQARIFSRRFSPIIVLTTRHADPTTLLALRGVADEVHVCGPQQIDFYAALAWLRRRWNVKRLLCEGGGELNGALFRAGLVDELHLTICPLIFGGRTAPTIADGVGVDRLAEGFPLRLKSRRRVVEELFLVFEADRSTHR
jgi:riboflavin-specific deaminase-like protein